MAEFGEQLRKVREEKGMTQQSLTEKVYVTRQTVSRWEGGERYPDLITAKKLASVLEVRIDDLLDNKEVAAVAEKNPVIQKTSISNITVILYALIVFTYVILGINNTPAYPTLYDDIANGDGYYHVQLLVEVAEIFIFVFGLLMTIQGKMNAKRTGYVTVSFFALESLQAAELFACGKLVLSVLIMIPYILGAISLFFFYIKQDDRAVFKYLIVIALTFGVARVVYTLYEILMYADHLYSSMNSFGALLTILIYVLFIYQMTVLSIKRKQAKEISE